MSYSVKSRLALERDDGTHCDECAAWSYTPEGDQSFYKLYAAGQTIKLCAYHARQASSQLGIKLP